MFFLCCALIGLLSAQEADQRVLGKSVEESYAGKIILIKVGEDDLGNGQSFKFWERTLERAEEEKAKAIVFHLDTPGGLAFPTHDIMSQITKLKIPTISYIDPMALSAGSMIAIATDRIYMAPGSTVGSSAVVNGSGAEIGDHMRAKIESYFDAHVRWIVEENGHRKEVVQAMMVLSDEDRQIGSQTVKKGKLLALNSKDAIEMLDDGPLFAVAEVGTLEEVLKMEGFSEDVIVEATPTGFEKFAWWVASVSWLLILVGLAAGYSELKTPGFGLGGVITLVVFAMFFFSNNLAGNMVGYELVAIFALGLLLIALEIFVIPGFGVAGISGLLLVIGSLVFAMIDSVAWDQRQWEIADGPSLLQIIEKPALHLAFGIFGSLIALWVMMRYLPDVPFMRKMMLAGGPSGGACIDEAPAAGPRDGMTGTATTDLRPSGKAEIDGEVIDVVAESDFILKGQSVRIIKEDGMGVVVKRA